MSFFDSILLNTICILFPLFCYFVYIAFRNNMNINESYENLVFELALISSVFFTIKLTGDRINTYTIILIDIPILFSYLKGKKIFSLLLSATVGTYYVLALDYNLYFIILEYTTYFILYKLSNKKSITASYTINTFTLIKSFLFSFYLFFSFHYTLNFFTEIKRIFISIIVFYLCSNLYYNLLLKGKEILNLNNSLKELEKEKTLRKSLFKLTHEIKNPIAVCKGYLDMLDINNKDNINRYIPIVRSEINRTLTIMDDFLDYTKIKVNKNIMDVNCLLEDTVNSMESLFNCNKVKTRITIKDCEYFIDGDYNRLKQVLVNVIKNSIEAKQKDSELKLHIYTKKTKNNISILVNDNGIGMDLDELNMLGETFYTTKEKGTGLGVTLSKEIVELHDGSIKYTSQKNKGTTVEITLPLLNL